MRYLNPSFLKTIVLKSSVKVSSNSDVNFDEV